MVTWAENSLHAFAVAANDSVEYRAWDWQAWTDWVDLGGTVSTTYPTPAPVAWGINHLDVFFVGTDSNLYHQGWGGAHWNAGWDNLGNSGEQPRSAPVAVCQDVNRLDVFAMGPHHQTMWRRSWDGGSWSGWESLGQIVSSPDATPAVAAWGPGRLDAFVPCAPNSVHHSGWGGGSWSGSWENLAGDVKAFLGLVFSRTRSTRWRSASSLRIARNSFVRTWSTSACRGPAGPTRHLPAAAHPANSRLTSATYRVDAHPPATRQPRLGRQGKFHFLLARWKTDCGAVSDGEKSG